MDSDIDTRGREYHRICRLAEVLRGLDTAGGVA